MTPEEMAEAVANAKATQELSTTVTTDPAEIEKALSDTVDLVEEVPPFEMELILAKIAKIHSEFNSRGDIPVDHEYWVLTNRLNSLRNP